MLRSPHGTDAPAPAETPEGASVLPAPGGGRLARVVQRGLFAGPAPVVPEDLYAVVERGRARRERHRVQLAPGSAVTTNTYFGRVHVTYWQRWTAVREFAVEAVLTGSGRLTLLASDTNKVWRAVAAEDVSGAGAQHVRLVAPVDRFVDGGGLWLEITTDEGELEVADVRWTVDVPVARRPTSVAICTYNRVEDCLNTLDALVRDADALDTVDLVQVVDQGSDPLESRERFTGIAGRLGDRLRYVRQPNLGGAGGFTRGLFDSTGGASAQRDTLLMDDDVLLEPEVLVRLTAFAACATAPMIVGGHMLNLLHPAHLHISAEYADPERLAAGQPMQDAVKERYLLGVDERLLPNVLDRRVDTEYNGWWACLIPAEVVRAAGYPLPVFFQWDDVEYAYRARAHGFPTVSLPGAAVWHADFGWKDWDEWHRYFNIRNALITAALHTRFSVRVVVTQLSTWLAQYLVGMQYGLAATLIEAVDDFLRGPDALDDGSVAAAARIRQIRAGYPETAVQPAHAVDVDFREMTVVRAANPPGRPALTWVKRAAYHLADRAVHRTGHVPAGDAHWWHVSLFERAVVTDMAQTGVRIRRRDRARALELARRGARTLRRLAAEGPSVAARYRAELGRLTSRENWARLYGVDGD